MVVVIDFVAGGLLPQDFLTATLDSDCGKLVKHMELNFGGNQDEEVGFSKKSFLRHLDLR